MQVWRNIFRNIRSWAAFNPRVLADHHEKQMLAIGRLLTRQLKESSNPNWQDIEFSIFSQWGDDGIIQFLIQKLNPVNTTFIEFGVENYTEANTRFLLINNNWKGLIIDGSQQNMHYVQQSNLYWRYDLTAVCNFVDCENVNNIFSAHGFTGKIGLLSIDVDGNDYWIWKSIHQVDPEIVIVEYNSIFGAFHEVTIPYSSSFSRNKAHHSRLFWGASLKAFEQLAEKKGYFLAGCNQNGNNAYFIKKEKAGLLPKVSVADGYVESRFRESFDASGKADFQTGISRLKVIEDLEIVDLKNDLLVKIKDLYRL